MKKSALIFLSLLSGLITAGTPTSIKLVNTNTALTIEFIPGDYNLKRVSTPLGDAQIISIDKGTPLLLTGAPDLPKLTTSIVIPDKAEMELRIVSSSYYDVPGITIAPSKGNLIRNINPSDVSYTYGSAYSEDIFFPASLGILNTPYIFRDYRGQSINVCPFQYNPQTKTLRVYTDIVVAVVLKNAIGGQNQLDRINSEKIADKEFEAIYQRQFINYKSMQDNLRYTPVSGTGSMLVICDDAFGIDMLPFVTWKNNKGITTDMVFTSIAGTTSAAIKAYINTYFSTHPNLKYILLVGDAAQMPSSSTSSGDSDNDYGYLSGNDSYPELFVGRFSATTSTQVQTMVNRTINYEKTPQVSGTWYKKGITIGSALGPGDDNEMDFEHERIIRNKLLAFTYNGVSENYDGSQGGIDVVGDPSPTDIETEVNNGVGIITYCGHGSDNEFVTSGFSSNDVHLLTNTNKNPFIWSVACVNGNFVGNAECFAESWLRQGTPSQPKGAIACLMSTINQSWNPPMEGQDAMVDILVESISGNVQRTFGGLSMNGCMQMNDAYPSGGAEMTDTWTLFGDPSVMVYTNTPAPMITSHATTAPLGTTSISVTCNATGALICLSRNGIILGTGVSNGTSAIITIPSAVAGVIDVTATAFNKMPYSGVINVNGSTAIIENNNETLFTVYPVPANNSLTISFMLAKSGKIKLALYTNVGQEIMSIVNEEIPGGAFDKTIDISTLAVGIYFCKLVTDNTVTTTSVIIQK